MNNKKKAIKKRNEDYIIILVCAIYLIYCFVTAKAYDNFMIASIMGFTWGLLFVFIVRRFKNLSPLYKFIASPFGGFFLMTQILRSAELSVYLMTSIIVMIAVDI